MKRCCNKMHHELTKRCSGYAAIDATFKAVKHDNRLLCPDILVHEMNNGTVGIVVHDGGESVVEIGYCPWCGSRL